MTEKVNIQLRASFNTSILRLVGVETIDVVAFSEVSRRKRKLEVMMVLDNSGSMCSPSCAAKLDRLKVAANTLVNILLDGPGAEEIVSIGLVPFSGSVNVGPGQLASGFIDVAGISPLQTEDIDIAAGTTLLSLYDDIYECFLGRVRESAGRAVRISISPMRRRTWRTGKLLWVPYFAPDEPGFGDGPGNDEGLGFYHNDYIDDSGIAGSDRSKSSATQPSMQGRRYHPLNCPPAVVQTSTACRSQSSH